MIFDTINMHILKGIHKSLISQQVQIRSEFSEKQTNFSPGMAGLQQLFDTHFSSMMEDLLVGYSRRRWTHFHIAQNDCHIQEVAQIR